MLFFLIIAYQFVYEWHVVQVVERSWCWWRKVGHTIQYPLVGLQYVVQIFVQSQAETAHSQVEEHAQRQHQSCDDVKPLLAERTCVGVGGHYWIVVQIA